jgi:phosphoglycerate dehydrogenase-like enzyme
MVTALVPKPFVIKFGDVLRCVAQGAGKTVDFITPPEQLGVRLQQSECDRIDCTFIDHNIRLNDQLYAAYSEAVLASNSLKWIHLWASGVGHVPFVPALESKGVLITSSTGANAEPVAQTGFAGLLMLARGFPQYIQGQFKREWRPLRGDSLPDDLRGQTVVIIGVGAIGRIFAGYARAFGLKVIGVRRTPRMADDPVDEMYPPADLKDILPRADWLVLACPLTKQTRNLISEEMFGYMREGVRIINIARGHIIDEAALISAIRSGKVGGAALDAHCQEPLPVDSPLWDLANVIISPKNATASTGNEKRYADMFIANFGHWIRGEPMFNVQHLQ